MELLVFQSMWAMERLPWRSERAWSREERVEGIASAGFAGAAVSFTDLADARLTVAELERRELRCVANAFPATVDELEPIVEAANELGVHHLNVQPNIRPLTVAEGMPFVEQILEVAAGSVVPLYIETHRDRLTTDLLFTIQLLDAVPELRLTADLSHYVVGREMAWPISEENHARVDRILERAYAFHGRVASREQVQLQIGFAHHREWLDLFAGWWARGFRRIHDRGAPDSVAFTCELGPPRWYAMTGPDGRELSDRWEEAQQLKALVEGIWLSVEQERAMARPAPAGTE